MKVTKQQNPKIFSCLIGLSIILSVAVRILYVTKFTEPDTLSWPDEKQYLEGAEGIAHLNTVHEFFTTPIHYKREPIYALFLTGILSLFPAHFLLAVRLIQSILFVVGAFFLYAIIKRFSNTLIALLGFIYFLFYPYYIYLGGTILPESIYVFILLVIIRVGIEIWQHKSRIMYYYFSILLALAFLTKATALSLVPLLIIAGSIIFYETRNLRHVVVSILLFFMLCTPCWYRNYQLGQKNMLLSRNDSAMMNENPYFSQSDKSLLIRTMHSFRMIPENTKRYFTLGPGDIQSQGIKISFFMKWISIVTVAPIFIGLIAGLWLLGKPHTRLLYLFYILYALPYIIILGDTRYRLPVDFIGIILLSLVLHAACYKTK